MKKLRLGQGVSKLMLLLWCMFIVSLPQLGQALESQSLAGHYYLHGVRETGSELRLYPEGRFEYFLTCGAYDESAAGTWTVRGERVLLNTAGAARTPGFRLKQSANQPDKPLTILVQDQNGRGLAGIDIIIDYADRKRETGYTQEYGWHSHSSRDQPGAIGLGIRMYNLEPQWFKVADRQENYFVFEFSPGDLGRAKFKDTPLRRENGDLIMEREGQRLRYVKGRGR